MKHYSQACLTFIYPARPTNPSSSRHSSRSERSHQALPIGQFSERFFQFCKYYDRFCEILNPPLYEGYPWHKSSNYHSQRGKRFCKVLHTCQFSGRYYQFFRFHSNVCEILNPPLYGGTPGISPVPIIIRRSKDFIRFSLLANFQKGTSNIAGFIPIFVKF